MTAPPPIAQPEPLSPSDERLWAGLAHVGGVLGPLPSLLILLILGPRSAFVKEQAREALNFVITAFAAIVVLGLMSVVLGGLLYAVPGGVAVAVSGVLLLVGLAQLAAYLVVIVLSIVAGVRVNQGGSYRYPSTVRLVR